MTMMGRNFLILSRVFRLGLERLTWLLAGGVVGGVAGAGEVTGAACGAGVAAVGLGCGVG